jgi:hypothetical protein
MAHDVLGAGEWIGIHDGLFVQASQIHDWACFPILPNDKNRPSNGYNTFDCGDSTICAGFIEGFVNCCFVAFGYAIPTFGIQHGTGLQKNLHAIFFRLDNSADPVLPKLGEFCDDSAKALHLLRSNIVGSIDVYGLRTEF